MHRFLPLKKTLKTIFSIMLVAGVFSLSSCVHDDQFGAKPIIRNGTIDLSNYAFDDLRAFTLDGPWLFWPDRLLSPDEVRRDIAGGYGTVTPVPGMWSQTGIAGSVKSLSKKGTLALTISLPPNRRDWAIRVPNADTACELFVDGRKVASVGTVGDTKKTSVPSDGLATASFTADSNTVLLVMHVSNFHTPCTGTWAGPTIGTQKSLADRRDIALIITALISGALFFMGLYHLTLYFFRKKDINSFLFAAISILLATRNLIMGERILNALFPATALGWEAAMTVELLSVHLALPLFFVFFRQLFPRQVRKTAVYVVLAVSAVWAALTLFTPVLFYLRFLSVFEYFILAAALYILAAICLALVRGEEGAGIVIAGLSVMLLTVLNDVLLSRGLIRSFYMTSIGMFFFLFSQAILLSVKFSQLFSIVERFTRELQALNQSLERFIPHEVLSFLDKRSIIDINLGDFTEENMSVFFLDIRDFTAFSERMTPNDTFHFINEFLERFGPIVRKHGGFIDKYLGDGFMALFPNDPDSALNAALEMREELTRFNGDHKDRGSPIRFGIGIHRGPLMLGTIGENQRMDSSVISDTVNTASRLEQLTKTHLHDILVSSAMVSGLKDGERYALHRIGSEQVKGRTQAIEVFALEGLAIDDLPIDELPPEGAQWLSAPI
jgi:class 3 adenylate cyclase